MSGSWQNAAGYTATTSQTGAYTISISESAAGTYQYRTVYAGSTTYMGNISNDVRVTVTEKMPGFEALAAIGALAAVFVFMAMRRRVR